MMEPKRNVATWRLRTRTLSLGPRTLVMGVVNITPDSFSDGGLFLDPDSRRSPRSELLDEGADLVDLGAESTRPGSHAGGAADSAQRRHPSARKKSRPACCRFSKASSGHAPTQSSPWTPTRPQRPAPRSRPALKSSTTSAASRGTRRWRPSARSSARRGADAHPRPSR